MASSKLLHNRWFGKALGMVAALIVSPPQPKLTLIWLACGIAVGHVFDVWSQRFNHPSQLGALWRRLNPSAANARPTMQFTFAAMGRIAKASGQVLPAHIDYAEELMRRLKFTPDDRHQAILWFTAGKDPAYPFAELAEQCCSESERTPVLREIAIECMCRAALITDNPDSANALLSLTGALQVDDATVDQVRASVAALVDDVAPAVAQAYERLGVTETASDADVKQAYRRMVARLHPDRLAHKANHREVKLAEKRMAECREALEIIQATR